MSDPVGERLAVVETKVSAIEDTLESINASLKELVSLKNRGAGALWLVSLIGVSALLAFGKLLWYRITVYGG